MVIEALELGLGVELGHCFLQSGVCLEMLGSGGEALDLLEGFEIVGEVLFILGESLSDALHGLEGIPVGSAICGGLFADIPDGLESFPVVAEPPGLFTDGEEFGFIADEELFIIGLADMHN